LEAKWIVGIDCAVDPQRTGAAVGVLSGDHLSLKRVNLCSNDCLPAATAVEFVEGQRDVLFALDAPLGWPQALGIELSNHKAGGPLSTCADRLFRRDTDRFIKCRAGKQPLDVGADRTSFTDGRPAGFVGTQLRYSGLHCSSWICSTPLGT
jgi:Protein of unknown function (DUF429)